MPQPMPLIAHHRATEAKPEVKQPATSPVTKEDVAKALQEAKDSITQGKKSDAAYAAAIQADVIQRLGSQHAAALASDDTRVNPSPGRIHLRNELHNRRRVPRLFTLHAGPDHSRPADAGDQPDSTCHSRSEKTSLRTIIALLKKEAGISTGSQREAAQNGLDQHR